MTIVESITDTVQSLFSERLARRREVRKQLAALELDKRAIEDAERSLRLIDKSKERAAQVHLEATAPAQKELGEINRQMTELLSDRQEIPPALETRRRELLQVVHAANERLQLEIDAQDKLAVPFHREINERRMRLTEWQIIENRLAAEPLANPEWIRELSSAGQVLHFARARCDSAREKVEMYQSALAQRRQFTDEANTTHEVRLANWQYELSAAQRALEAAKAEVAALHRKILDE